MKKEFDITGMTCAACAARIERVVRRIEGVDEASVNLAAERLSVEAKSDVFKAVVAAVEKAGFGAIQHKKNAEKKDKNTKKIRDLKRKLILAACFTLPLFYLAMGPMMGLPIPSFIAPDVHPLFYAAMQMILAVSAMTVGWRFYTVGYSSLLRGSPNMDSLIAVGTTASFGYSVYSLIRIANGYHHGVHELYFESCGVIISLILFGKMLEAISKGKTSKAIEGLMELVPATTFVLREGIELEVPTSKLQLTDILILKPGSRIPADGTVLCGQSTVDESMLTGESIPVEKQEGSCVYAGSVNQNGSMQVKILRLGEETTLGEMIRMVEEAQGSKAPIARFADVVSAYFVPIVMGIAFLSALAWKLGGESWGFALSVLVSVLVIACPCALGLATPTAIMVGIGKGAEYGILFKNGEAVEELHRIKTVVLDKTGTLTTGKPTLNELILSEGYDEKELLELFASAEYYSEHPLGLAVLEYARLKDVELKAPQRFEAFLGYGVFAESDGHRILAGNERLMTEKGISFTDFQPCITRYSQEGKTLIFISVDENPAGIAAIADVLKEDSVKAVSRLQKRGIDVVMLTGDTIRTAQSVAKQVGITEIRAEVLPGEKVNVIKELQSSGKKVAMVGDGINDAAALATADVGIAIGSGTDIAIGAADVVLMHGNLTAVPLAAELSSATIRNIKQNLFWAFAYNTLGIPIAAGLLHLFGGPLLNPMIGAAAMSLSSVSVVSNALRLRRFKEKKDED